MRGFGGRLNPSVNREVGDVGGTCDHKCGIIKGPTSTSSGEPSVIRSVPNQPPKPATSTRHTTTASEGMVPVDPQMEETRWSVRQIPSPRPHRTKKAILHSTSATSWPRSSCPPRPRGQRRGHRADRFTKHRGPRPERRGAALLSHPYPPGSIPGGPTLQFTPCFRGKTGKCCPCRREDGFRLRPNILNFFGCPPTPQTAERMAG